MQPSKLFQRAALFLLLILGTRAAQAADPLTAYDDQLQNGFQNWSSPGYTNLNQNAVVHSGSLAVSFNPANWQVFYLHHDGGISFGEYDALEFWIHGGSTGGQVLRFTLMNGTTLVKEVPLANCLPGGTIPANQWIKVRVPFASLGLTSGSFDGFYFMQHVDQAFPTVYFDDFQITPNLGPVNVTLSNSYRSINPLIYGVNFGSAAQAARLRWPVRRWGGNATTRYNWQTDVANRANDWFFLNAPWTNPDPATGSAADHFIDDTRAAGGEVLLTLPMIGWTPADATSSGFSVAKYGAQQANECSWQPWPCHADAGNGVRPDGTWITGNDPYDTSRPAGVSFTTDYMAHVASRVGTAGQGGVKFFSLDNEPMLWNSTHRDVHPSPVTYDEIWQKTLAYGTAIKAQDPSAQLFGPVTWGWCDLFSSAYDAPGDCMNGPDRDAHGGVPFLDWYLQQVRDYELSHGGLRLVDWVDVHYYPQGAGITDTYPTPPETPDVAARRLRSLRALWDPTYSDESWIGQPVYLIPRLKQTIQNRLPGAKLAITEYNWGPDDQISAALAQAEALAIFGREGVDLATRWQAPKENSLTEDAFRLFLNYDGYGTRIIGTVMTANNSNPNMVGVYGAQIGYKRVGVLLFNKDTVSRQVNTQLPGTTYNWYLPKFYHFSGTQRLGSVPSTTVGFSYVNQGTYNQIAFKVTLPARSATLVVIDTL